MSDLIDRQTAIDALEGLREKPSILEGDYEFGRREMLEACIDEIEELPSTQQWIPIKMRPMDAEEREYWEDYFDYELTDEDAVLFDCKMPDDGQEILVSYRKWIGMDKCEIDCGCYGLEGNGDWEGVVAWMPIPEPYKEDKNGTGSLQDNSYSLYAR